MKITAFVPCRAGSQRIPRKNIREFAGNKEGLIGIKLDQLMQVSDFDEILVSSNDHEVLKIVKQKSALDARIKIDVRADHLCSSETSTDDLIKYVPTIIDDGHVLWTHVTSPFFGAPEYAQSIAAYREAISEGAFDSLMSVEKIQAFLWDENGPINFDRKVERWPRTQTLRKLYEVNSAVFLSSLDGYRKHSDRIGLRPKLMDFGHGSGMDIDWYDDFIVAEQLWKVRAATVWKI